MTVFRTLVLRSSAACLSIFLLLAYAPTIAYSQPATNPKSKKAVKKTPSQKAKTKTKVVLGKVGVTLNPAELLQALKSQLANFKVPKQCVVLPELPRNAMGKVQKNVLRDHALSLRAMTMPIQPAP